MDLIKLKQIREKYELECLHEVDGDFYIEGVLPLKKWKSLCKEIGLIKKKETTTDVEIVDNKIISKGDITAGSIVFYKNNVVGTILDFNTADNTAVVHIGGDKYTYAVEVE
jgi:hypothetical protein